MSGLTGQRALVTGGSRGIGAAIVRRLTAEGRLRQAPTPASTAVITRRSVAPSARGSRSTILARMPAGLPGRPGQAPFQRVLRPSCA